MSKETNISIRGAREHNLKEVDLDIPKNKLVVMTGISGSGKSSIAFDTVYAEGQRRYVESLSAYARQFLEMMQKPDVDHIEGLSPAISIEQKTSSRNPRSTVGTVTEIYDYLRLLFSRIGIPHSPATGLPIASQTVTEMVDDILQLPEGSKLLLLAPMVRGRKGEYNKEIKTWIRKGVQRFLIDNLIYDAEQLPSLDKKKKHDISLVVDRVIVRKDQQERITQSAETALNYSDGLLETRLLDQPDVNKLYSTKYACPVSDFSLPELEPRIFSFNNPHGACTDCNGLGYRQEFVPEAIVPNGEKTLNQGALLPWASQGGMAPYYSNILRSLGEAYGFDLDTQYSQLTAEQQYVIMYGTDGKAIDFLFEDGDVRSYRVQRKFEGIIGNLSRRLRETESNDIREQISKYQVKSHCLSCNGYRLKAESLTVLIANKHIGELVAMSANQLLQWIAALPNQLGKQHKQIARRILKEIGERLEFLNNVGLGYLTLSRSATTLSGGESQRIRLASQIGSGLSGIIYVMDEPSIGLHQRDNDRLLRTLVRLRDLGNTVIVVEHDEETIRRADYVFDIGPGAGIHGGKLVASGTPDEIAASPHSVTGQFLSGRRSINVPKTRRPINMQRQLSLTGVTTHNLKNVDLKVPLGCFTCITGVSGSGKSSLILQTLYPALSRALGGFVAPQGNYNTLDGVHLIDKVIDINQSPIGRTPRSNPATYTGAFTLIRDWFANLPKSKERGYNPGRFSFNVRGGRCEACKGGGMIKIEMHFLPDVYITCEACQGKCYGRDTLEITYNNKSIADVLAMTVDEGVEYFAKHPAIKEKLSMLQKVGLGYIKIGQQATTLSGGEAQRIKLAKELSRRSTGQSFYLLDEPTTGLHFHDVEKLLSVLQQLVAAGNTVLVVEHNLDVIKTADWIIDIGPDGGDAGGQIVAEGTPEMIARNSDSHTGRFLLDLLQSSAA